MEVKNNMENTTVTISVEPSSFTILMNILKILDTLDLESSYVFNPSDIIYTTSINNDWLKVNIPVELYVKFEYYRKKLSK